jgi:mannose-6-phosphate isomerase-like protein (cupin superfamily)
MTTLKLTPTESVTVRAAEPGALEVEALYGPNGSAPPKHLHPAQAEHFEVLEGSLRTFVQGRERVLQVGDTLEIPAGSVHQMWNPGSAPARVLWRTSPAGRTLEWFEALDALQREGRVLKSGIPSPLAMSVLLTEYRDVFRLAGPDPVLRAAFAMLAPLGRLRGYSTKRSGIRSASAPPYE